MTHSLPSGKIFLLGVAAMAFTLLCPEAGAQPYPARPIRIIIPFVTDTA